MTQRAIPLVDATTADLTGLGHIIGVPDCVPPRPSAFYGEAVGLWSPAAFVSDADTTLTIARISPRRNEVVFLERHFKHTQAFIPLGGRPFILVMAPPNPDGLPDPDSVKAYRFSGDAGFLMHIGTWHEFPYAVVPDTDVIVILRNETNRNLKAIEHGEAIGEDLEKRNVQMRLGVTLTFDPATR